MFAGAGESTGLQEATPHSGAHQPGPGGGGGRGRGGGGGRWPRVASPRAQQDYILVLGKPQEFPGLVGRVFHFDLCVSLLTLVKWKLSYTCTISRENLVSGCTVFFLI